MTRAAFLDRDGTIIRDYPDAAWAGVREPEFLEGAMEAMAAFREMGYRIILLTNQYVIGEGWITREQYERFSCKMMARLERAGAAPDAVYVCPHARSAGCHCCKPEPGMVERALQQYPDVDLGLSFLAGDSWRDRELARRMGLAFWGIGMAVSDYGKTAASLKDVARQVGEAERTNDLGAD
jgi:D-glycero-D-manno-heptose 1,7-bisphosphate phosphatase